MTKKILLIPMGGTICTAPDVQGILSVHDGAALRLVDAFMNSDCACREHIEIQSMPNRFLLSENITVEHWNQLLNDMVGYLKADQWDGVILLHGTDSLAYTAALLSLLFCDCGVPVFLVSANAPLSDMHSNGFANFRAAAECICYGIPSNVYVPYRNPSDGKTWLHMASQVRQIGGYSEDLYSVGRTDISGLCADNAQQYVRRLEKQYPHDCVSAVTDPYREWKLQPCVLQLHAHVGLRYDTQDYAAYKAVLHVAYHSGTVCVQPDAGNVASFTYLLERCTQTGTDVYVTPSRLDGQVYSSLKQATKHPGKAPALLYGCTEEMAYIKLLLAYGLYTDAQQRSALIQKEWNFENTNK